MDKIYISIIIPALNEGGNIQRTIGSVSGRNGIEVIVVDGGSSDDTALKAGALASRVISAPRGRASQMNAGASEAKGEVLFFLHADCIPPEDFPRLIKDSLEKTNTVAGAFDIRVEHESRAFRLIERMANLRSRLTRIPYGDQGLFISRPVFEHLRGFSDIPLMEDMEMGGRLKNMGKMDFQSSPILVSPRRWLREGIVRTTLRDWSLALAYSVLKVPPGKLAGYYGDAK